MKEQIRAPKRKIRDIIGQARGIKGYFAWIKRELSGNNNRERNIGEERFALVFDFPKNYHYLEYLPSYSDIRTQIDGMVELYGKNKVERELNIKIDDLDVPDIKVNLRNGKIEGKENDKSGL